MEKDCIEADVVDYVSLFNGYRIVAITFSVDKPYCVVERDRSGQYRFRKTKKPGDALAVRIEIYSKSTKRLNFKRILNQTYLAGFVRLTKAYGYTLYIMPQQESAFTYTPMMNSIRKYTYTLRAKDIKDPTHVLKYLLKTKE